MEGNINILFLNIQAQTKFELAKQLQLQDLVRKYNIDILQLQEIDIDKDTFEACDFIRTNYNVITNNSDNKYGTASLIKTDLEHRNVRCDT